MGSLSKDFHVTVRVKNGRIISRMRELGFTSVVALARESGVHHQEVGKLILFKTRPLARNDWSPNAYAISAALRCEPEDLWPEHIARLKARSGSLSFDADLEQVQAITSHRERNEFFERAQLPKLISALPPREQEVIKARFGLNCPEERVDEIADRMGLSTTRIYQFEAKALRRMKRCMGVVNG